MAKLLTVQASQLPAGGCDLSGVAQNDLLLLFTRPEMQRVPKQSFRHDLMALQATVSFCVIIK